MYSAEKHMIIVGAGIVGASIAFHLATRGVKVTVIDQSEPASGATGSSFGWIHTTVSDDAPDILLRRASVEDWHRLEQEVPELSVHWGGALSYGDALSGQQDKEKILKQSDISQLEPAMNAPPLWAYYAKQDGAVDPEDATRVLLNKARSLGATVKTQTPVTGFIKTGSQITGIQTPREVVNADSVILACGTGISPLLTTIGISLPVMASPAILLRYSISERVVNTLISGNDIEVRHARNGDILAAEDYPATGSTEDVALETLAAIKQSLKGTESVHLLRQSVGQRPMLHDGYPVMGFVGGVTGVYVAVMHPAVTCAATVGRMVSEELISGKNLAIPEIYRPTRFKI
ncbi:NAD(P)/FAD-dependent oxidoreductase [Serratia grimesii]|jgi:glycine/D-amino acid oxidase-like deaminating enzyme|uniref:FAD-dependent oxidoreductase n=1 Tax=Serratia grimesii TaxID=82995 RepID=A0ABR4UEN7_9GAMM|nr:FAD-binding oxidoreductase [Serratia grimesii]KFB90389.1 FAD-dependent oxidoreductase [Serratia grimesii]CAI0926916.1 Monomeric sarcosine oxidase [Serratia grimesii]